MIGLGMGTGLYDAVFAALGRLYGSEARGPITNLTLFGGFASTICWPLSAFMIDHVGWRIACLIYAGAAPCRVVAAANGGGAAGRRAAAAQLPCATAKRTRRVAAPHRQRRR